MPTGDMASIDPRGRILIRDREKDLIKSGGEWISSIALERLILSIPAVRLVAVVARPHPHWQERPVAIVELDAGHTLTLATLQAHLGASLPRWQIPDDLLLEPIPLTGTGKIDKKRIRALLDERGYRLPVGSSPGE
jgi:fatty-acyl-CoA synthase